MNPTKMLKARDIEQLENTSLAGAIASGEAEAFAAGLDSEFCCSDICDAIVICLQSINC